LRREYSAAGKGRLFDVLRPVVWGGGAAGYEEIGRALAMSEGAIKVAVHRLRLRFKECLQAEVAHTVSSPAEVQDELRYLLSALSL
jgi:RNA polymerase sigma-70 factor (ECF subfamily)